MQKERLRVVASQLHSASTQMDSVCFSIVLYVIPQ